MPNHDPNSWLIAYLPEQQEYPLVRKVSATLFEVFVKFRDSMPSAWQAVQEVKQAAQTFWILTTIKSHFYRKVGVRFG